jgi:uncharacterized coiled-coil protein SlyX
MIKPVWDIHTLDELNEQITERRKMMSQMVGTLYTSILQHEIHQLKALRFTLLYTPSRIK